MWNLEEFKRIYERQQESRLSARHFCENEGINEARFYYWKHKLQQEKEPPCFVPVKIASSKCFSFQDLPAQKPSSGAYEIIYPNGVILRLQTMPTQEELHHFLML